MGLITNPRAKYNLPNATTADDKTINALIESCSSAIQRYCRRDFTLTTYDELYDDRGQNLLMLRQYPIQSIDVLRSYPLGVIRVRNTDTTTNQQARIAVQKDGLLLTRTASGVKTVDTSATWASYPTLSALASAIKALSNGWSAEVLSDWGKWPSEDLRLPQGALSCRNSWVDLKMHTTEWNSYDIDEKRGYVFLRQWNTETDFSAFPVANNAYDQGSWIRPNYFRVQYTAGYNTVPEDVQQACAIWVAILFYQTQRDPGLVSSQSDAQGFYSVERVHGSIPSDVKTLLAPWRRYSVMV